MKKKSNLENKNTILCNKWFHINYFNAFNNKNQENKAIYTNNENKQYNYIIKMLYPNWK